MPREPYFIDSWGSTIRLDPPAIPGNNMRLTLVTPVEYNEAGNTIQQGRVMEIYLSKDQAKLLADVLHATAVEDLFTRS